MAKIEKKKTTPKKEVEINKKETKITKKQVTKEPVKKEVTTAVKVEDKKDERKEEDKGYIRTLLAAVLIILIFIGGYLAVQYKKHHTNNSGSQAYVMTEDEQRFKEEYETLNNTIRSNGKKNKAISVVEDNNIVYITLAEAVNILDSKTGVIYFGYAADPVSRNAVPVLLNAMASTSLDKIYYVNIRPNDKDENDLRDIYTLDDKNKAKVVKESSKTYSQLVALLASELDEYLLTTSKGKKVDTGVKRLNTPTVVAVKEGEIVGFHEGTVDGHVEIENEDLRDLTNDEEDKLFMKYATIFSNYLGTGCDIVEESGC